MRNIYDDIEQVMQVDKAQVMKQCEEEMRRTGGDSPYPYYAGGMDYHFLRARQLLGNIAERCKKAESRLRALEWAVEINNIHEHIAEAKDAMVLFDVADMVEKSGLSDEQLTSVLRDGLSDEQIEQQQLVVDRQPA